jgi:hypothetical protein
MNIQETIDLANAKIRTIEDDIYEMMTNANIYPDFPLGMFTMIKCIVVHPTSYFIIVVPLKIINMILQYIANHIDE